VATMARVTQWALMLITSASVRGYGSLEIGERPPGVFPSGGNQRKKHSVMAVATPRQPVSRLKLSLTPAPLTP